MANDDAKVETIDVNDLLRTLISRLTGIEDVQKELRDGQKEANAQQAQTNVHLVQINGTLSVHEHGIRSHSGKLADQADRIANLIANQRVIMATTELQDKHQAQGIRDASGDAWAAQQTAADVRTETTATIGEIRKATVQAAVGTGLILLAGMAALVAIVVVVFG